MRTPQKRYFIVILHRIGHKIRVDLDLQNTNNRVIDTNQSKTLLLFLPIVAPHFILNFASVFAHNLGECAWQIERKLK
jgi:hypothetical protein